MQGRPGQSEPHLKFLRFSKIDCVEYELRLLMTGVSFSVRRPYVNSRRERLYTHSLTFRKISPSKLTYQKLNDFFQIVNKTLVLQGSRLFFIKVKIKCLLNNINNFFMLFGNFIFCTINFFLKFEEIFMRNENFIRFILISYNKFRSTPKVEN